MHLVDVMTHVTAKGLSVELIPFKPTGVRGFSWNLMCAGLIKKQFYRGVAVVSRHRPTFAVHPHAIHAIHVAEFLELRNQKFIHVRPKGGREVVISSAFRIHPCPIRMLLYRHTIPDPRIVHIQGHAAFSRHLPPDFQRIANEPRRRIAHFRRVT